MRITKVIRDYMEKELSEKRYAANKHDAMRAAYEEQKAAAEREIKALLPELNEKIQQILARHGMDTTIVSRGDTMEAACGILRFYDADICNDNVRSLIRDNEAKRYRKQKEFMEKIELECALGADRDGFMKMLSEISFD